MRHRGTRHALAVWTAVLLGAALWATVAVAPPAAKPSLQALAALDAPAALAADDLGVTTRARYVVAPDAGAVRVTVDLSVLNQKPNRVSGGVITRYFFNGVNLGVQTEATHLRATQDGVSVPVSSEKRRGYRLVSLKFRSNLYVDQTAKLRLTFDLPAGDPRSTSDVRVGPAFATFLAWAFGDKGTIRVEVPRPFRVDVSGADMTKQPGANGSQVFTGSTDDAIDWFAWINARNDNGLTRDRLDLPDGERIVVRGWPEDTRWRRRVMAILTRSLPDLVERIGLPWPVDGPLNVLEVHTPLLEGYAGFYDPGSDEITISENLDDTTIVHEASHAWFNSGLFTERWINEGLAQEYSSRVLQAATRGTIAPGAVKRSEKVAFPLGSWPPPAPIRDPQAGAREAYGYDASWSVIRRIVDGAGEAGMRRVFEAAAAHTTAYPGAGTPERTALPNDWRRLLDLSEEVGGATGVERDMKAWVLSPQAAAQLDGREPARTAYHRLVADGGGWAAPAVVRLALDAWQFADASASIADAEAVLAQRAAIDSAATADGLAPTKTLEDAYEGATTKEQLAAVATEATASRTALSAVATAERDVTAPRDWLVGLGLTGKDPDADLAAARSAWEAGDYATATDRATLASGTLAVAADAGRNRATLLGVGVAVLALLVLIVAVAAWRRARRRVARPPSPPPPSTGDSLPPPPAA